MNNYVRVNPQTLLNQSTKWITNGVDNSYFNIVENAYLGSPTNQSIIDNFTNYILGEGIEDKNNIIDVESILSDEDLRNAVADFKTQGACSFQVIYNFGNSVSKLYYVPVKSLAVNKEADITDEPTSYWYSFDWQYKTKYKPVEIPAFGKGNGLETEILYIKRHSAQPVYSLPDWQSGIQYCQTEEELSNYYISHIKNNFSAGKIININQGGTDSEEAMEETRKTIINNLSGSSNAGNIVVSFNDNKDNATTVDSIEITDAFSQFQFLSQECVEKIMLSHKVNDKSLFGLPMPSGFNSVAEQMVQSLKILYRSQIKPTRKILLAGLQMAFDKVTPNTKLEFVDFEELRVQDIQTANPTGTTMSSIDMDASKISFDFDDVLTTPKGLDLLDRAQRADKTVYIVSARWSKTGLDNFAKEHNIPDSRVFATGSNKAKIEKVLELNVGAHWDNNNTVVADLPGIGKDINKL
jgi:hypothetical protein